MQLIIMTRGRVHKQRTLESIPQIWWERTKLVCPPEEREELQSLVPPGVIVIPFHHPNPNYSTKFQAIMEGSVCPTTDKICILDDDLIFSERVGDKLVTLRGNDVEKLSDMFYQMEELLHYHVQVGVHPRQMGHQAPLPVKENGKVIVVNGLNRRKLKQMGFPRVWRVDQHPILADTRLNMEVLLRGWGNVLITTHCVDWAASQADGGCDYRTMEMQEAAIDDLVKDFGPFIKKVIKKPKSAKWLGEERVDFTAQWKKAYKTGLVRLGMD